METKISRNQIENIKKKLLESTIEEDPEDFGSSDERYTTLQTIHNHISSKNSSVLIKEGVKKCLKKNVAGN